MNTGFLNLLPGEERSYYSVDNISSQDQSINYSTEFLNSLEPIGTTLHNILLKLGAPIILICNLNPPKLCKSIRRNIKSMMPHVLEVIIMPGKYAA